MQVPNGAAMDMARPRITITDCTQCQWLLRSAWLAQELLPTFGADLGEVALVPGTGGVSDCLRGRNHLGSQARRGLSGGQDPEAACARPAGP
jgi:predicted Rdx family selenoprotein